MSVQEAAQWHRLQAWRDDVELDIRCRSCGVPIRVGDTYRVAGISMLCTLRPFCPSPAVRVVKREKRRSPQWKRRRRLIVVGKRRTSHAPIATCRCGASFRQQSHRGYVQLTCSRPCVYRLLEERATQRRARVCAVCEAAFVFRSEHPTQQTCSPSCGARLRERRKRERRAA